MSNNSLSNTTSLLTRQQCTALKGVAIFMIFIHNMVHWFPGDVQENEYMFNLQNTLDFFSAIFHPGHNWPLQFFSFLGHYGVPLFVFLSAYGLVKKYELSHRDTPAPSRTKFIISHYFKLLLLIFIGMMTLFFAMLLIPVFDASGDLYPSKELILNSHYIIPSRWWPWQASMTINFTDDDVSRLLLGPYWYFGFVLQLYIIYRLFLFTRDHGSAHARYAPVAFAALCWLVMVAAQMIWGDATLNFLRYNFFIGGLPFALGLLAARYEQRLPCLSSRYWALILVVAAIAVPVMNLNFHLWLWAPIAVVAAGIALVKVAPRALMAAMTWMGGISMMLFVLHPVTRMVFYNINQTVHPYTLTAIYIAISLPLAALYTSLYNKLIATK